jgi:DtxR family Mn-dependent transcriptional regulator
MLSAPAEDCLLLVHRFTEREEPVSTSRLARGLGVTDSTVTAMIQKLARQKLLNHKPRREISLTPAGSELAIKMIRRHRLIESFLHDKLGYAWDEVHAEAEQIEHAVSEKFVEAISKALNHPTLDPHGDPIPDESGSGDPRVLVKLSEAPAGLHGVLARVLTGKPDVLIYLAEQGLKPGAVLELLESSPHDSIIRVRVGHREVSLGEKLAGQIMVERL